LQGDCCKLLNWKAVAAAVVVAVVAEAAVVVVMEARVKNQ